MTRRDERASACEILLSSRVPGLGNSDLRECFDHGFADVSDETLYAVQGLVGHIEEALRRNDAALFARFASVAREIEGTPASEHARLRSALDCTTRAIAQHRDKDLGAAVRLCVRLARLDERLGALRVPGVRAQLDRAVAATAKANRGRGRIGAPNVLAEMIAATRAFGCESRETAVRRIDNAQRVTRKNKKADSVRG